MVAAVTKKPFSGPCLAIALVVALALGTLSARAETITLMSGNGVLKQRDSLITFHSGSPGAPLPSLGAPEFDAAEAGAQAWICGPLYWITTLPCNPQAQWIGIDASGTPATALYAMHFTIQSSAIKSATFDFCWAVDDRLGDVAGHPEGVFINRAPIPAVTGGDFTAQYLAGPIDITGLVQPGSNTLFVYNQDIAYVVSGVVFQAVITVEAACQAAADAGADATVCQDGPTTLSGGGSVLENCGGAPEYLWSWPGNPGSWSSVPEITVSPAVTTTYTLEGRCASEPDCTSQDDVTVTVHPYPTADAGPDAQACRNQPFLLDASSSAFPGCLAGHEFQWSLSGTPLTSWTTQASLSRTSGTAGVESYQVEARCATAPDCVARDSVTIAVVHCPTAVRFGSYDARASASGVVEISWNTLLEIDTLGFIVEGRDSEAAPPQPVHPGMVPARGSGSAYRVTAASPAMLEYRVREVTAAGEPSVTPYFRVTAQHPRAVTRSRTRTAR